MKHLFPTIILFSLLFNSCIEEPFDDTQLDYDYWQMFSGSMELVAFDNFATSAQGFYNDSKLKHYIYTSEMVDLITHDQIYFMHFRLNNIIQYSLTDSLYFTSEDKRPKIEWTVNDKGIIEACMKFDNEGNLIGSERYDIELNQFIQKTENGISYPGRLLYIHEKQKFNEKEELVEVLKYTYGDNDTYEITRYNSKGIRIN